MRSGVVFAYIFIVLLWSTTPLAIKWSGEGPGFLFGVTARMTIGAVCTLMVLGLSQQRLVWHRKAMQTYLAVALQIYGAMLIVYWAAQFIPSGWISVIFGLTPLMTALLAALWLSERSLTIGKVLSYILGVAGLAIMFGSAVQLGREAVVGIVGVLVSTLLQSVSAVWVKRIDAKLPALTQVTGGLLVALPLYLMTWLVIDGHWPTIMPITSWGAIVYLGVIATTIGFILYYYLLIHLVATQVALITLVSPVMALALGHFINHEPLTIKVLAGTALILLALMSHQFFDRVTSKTA
jgi:drug/metabolite transporter (DMT)-like permease